MEISYDKRIFAANLNRYIGEKGVNSSDICEYLDVSKSVVSDWRNARKMPRMDKVERLAYYFGVGLSDLIEEKPATSNDGLSDVDNEIIMRLHQLSPEEWEKVDAFVQGLLASRSV